MRQLAFFRRMAVVFVEAFEPIDNHQFFFQKFQVFSLAPHGFNAIRTSSYAPSYQGRSTWIVLTGVPTVKTINVAFYCSDLGSANDPLYLLQDNFTMAGGSPRHGLNCSYRYFNEPWVRTAYPIRLLSHSERTRISLYGK